MKLIIEIDSDELKRAVENQVAAEVALLTTEAIHTKIAEILPVKFGRVTESVVADAVAKHASKLVNDVYSPMQLQRLVDAAIVNIAKEALRK